jgi:DNA-binding NarL/FixJ family response regulator
LNKEFTSRELVVETLKRNPKLLLGRNFGRKSLRQLSYFLGVTLQRMCPYCGQPISDSTQLSERAIEVQNFVTQGLSETEIGQRLGITEQTVRYHLRNLRNQCQ